jgi:heme exporter protein A
MLSSGQRRRLALARLSLSACGLWILDEPFTSLDEKGKVFMKQRFVEQLSAGGIIVLTSHEPVLLDGISPVQVCL